MYTCRNYYDAATFRTEFYWSILREKNISVKDFFLENKFNNIAIYGLNKLGKDLFNELKESEINICGIIDKYKNGEFQGKRIYKLGETKSLFEEVDAVVVAPILSFNLIVDDLIKEELPLEKILHIDDIIFNQVWGCL